ncbi:MidA family (MidA) (PDB:1ZKD) [Commensalibacter communis]|uniref:class I SAM-dependent methyltransferase n=1 Tax=Commensalibacter communis TaxID=2972786 RepID=UPI0022FF6543|nr:SAM-dependent methyltransferase [Commensalibacter communis]CAI3949099.1 MidA family (MidA) (PDB:1ZKD) [Commensalibacter communis]CAI3951572.1 MidA family (MidA) (PDB:1ZKD) [Commensalibacter communis]
MTNSQPIRLDHFMAAANAAYYGQKNPFADFITAPEISQMFGELIAAWVIAVIHAMPDDSAITLVEAGPGQGTLMADMLRVIRQAAPDIYQNCSVIFVETSKRLRQIQKQAIAHHTDISVRWYDSIDSIPYQPMILVANEFLDALPIRQFVKVSSGEWAEHYVYQGQLFQKQVADLPKAPIFQRPVKVGDIVEVCEAGQDIIKTIAQRIYKDGGAALFIDYGYASPVWGDTLQAIAGGEKVSPFIDPGEADLTAHIDFLALKEIVIATGARAYGIQTQGEFLKQLGLLVRAKMLAASATEIEQKQIAEAVYRLIDPSEMGDLFKVMAIMHPDLPIPPAFELNKEIK